MSASQAGVPAPGGETAVQDADGAHDAAVATALTAASGTAAATAANAATATVSAQEAESAAAPATVAGSEDSAAPAASAAEGAAPAAKAAAGESVPRVSIVIPAYNESDNIVPALDRIFEGVLLTNEVLVVVDSLDDTTIAAVERYRRKESRLRWLHNTYGRGPANAIRFGIDAARAKVVVVTMADGCDDPQQIDDLVRLVERGVAVAAASRYMPGGAQVGGPMLKGILSAAAGRSLRVFARIGTRDATNSFKAYSTDFVRRVGIESRAGFEIGIELTAKARRARLPVAEIPTIWLDRQQGVSNFKLAQWIPKYLRWYFFAYGRPLPLETLAARSPRETQEKD